MGPLHYPARQFWSSPGAHSRGRLSRARVRSHTQREAPLAKQLFTSRAHSGGRNHERRHQPVRHAGRSPNCQSRRRCVQLAVAAACSCPAARRRDHGSVCPTGSALVAFLVEHRHCQAARQHRVVRPSDRYCHPECGRHFPGRVLFHEHRVASFPHSKSRQRHQQCALQSRAG